MILTPFKESGYCKRLESFSRIHSNKNLEKVKSITTITDDFLKNIKFRIVTLNYDKTQSSPQSYFVMANCFLPINNPEVKEVVRRQIYSYLQEERSKALTQEDKHLINMFSFFVDLGIRTNEQELTKQLTQEELKLFDSKTDINGKIHASISCGTIEKTK
ncbi:MAG: hypothetical protein J6J24_04130 [Clostridia bacterium]|nr:hypothetical protein [Clostridia bacterium]